MPAIAKTTDDEIVRAARAIIAERGVDSLSMQSIGEAVGIRAPSLYKRFTDRESIVRHVQVSEFAELARTIEAQIADLSPNDALRSIAKIYLKLAQSEPKLYAILFALPALTSVDDISIRTRALAPLFNVCRELVGPGTALAAARTLSAYIHGFISLQLAGAFEHSAGIEGSYFFGLNAIIKGVTAG